MKQAAGRGRTPKYQGGRERRRVALEYPNGRRFVRRAKGPRAADPPRLPRLGQARRPRAHWPALPLPLRGRERPPGASLRSKKPGKDDRDLFGLHLGQARANSAGMAAAANVRREILEVGGEDLCRVHVRPPAYPVEAEVVEVNGKGQHRKKRAFYGRFGNGTREIADPDERDRYRLRIWGP